MSTKNMELLTESAIDTLVLYTFLKKLTTPFEKWDAYDLGIIDQDGNILKPRRTLKTQKEKAAFDLFDLFVRNIKRLIQKFPGGRSKIATYAAGLFLLKEQKNASWYVEEDMAYEAFMDFYEVVMDNEQLQKEILEFIRKKYSDIEEEAPVNSVGVGAHVAGLTEPVVRTTPKERRKKKRKKFREYM